MTDYLNPDDYKTGKTGPQFWWLDQRLVVHGYPPFFYDDTLKRRVQKFQWDQGWTGTGADGFVGPETLRRLAKDPVIVVPVKMDITGWKLTVPVGEPEHPTEIKQPQLNATTVITSDKGLVVFERNQTTGTAKFRANHGGVTTSGSSNPRSELREMTKDGSALAKWSTTSGKHVLEVVLIVHKLTTVKPHVVIAQIHGADDDVTVLRLEGKNLWITNGDTTHGKLLTDNYVLGQQIRFSFTAEGGKVKFTYNGSPVSYEVSSSDSANYFKTGCYLQSNPTTAPSENPDAYAEVEVLALKVTHS